MTLDDVKNMAKEKWIGFKDTVSRAWRWVLNNPLYSIGFATIGMRIVGGIYRAIRIAKKEAKEEERRLETYDRRTGEWVPRTRTLTGKEMLYVDQEWQKGRTLADIYAELGVLRY